MDRYGISQVSYGLSLRLEIVNLPRRIGIKHQLSAPHIIRALCRFGERLIDGAAAVDDDARPRSGRFQAVLSSKGVTRGEKKCPRHYPRESRHGHVLFSMRTTYQTEPRKRYHT